MRNMPKVIGTGKDIYNLLGMVQAGTLEAAELREVINGIEEEKYSLFAGGGWGNGVGAGCRAVGCSNCPWIVSAYIGARFGCDLWTFQT